MLFLYMKSLEKEQHKSLFQGFQDRQKQRPFLAAMDTSRLQD